MHHGGNHLLNCDSCRAPAVPRGPKRMIGGRPDPGPQRNAAFRMPATARTWSIFALTLGYLLMAHLAFTNHAPWAAAVAVGLLAALVLIATRRSLWRWFVLLAGAALVILAARGFPPLPLMMPPVIIPAAIAITFGRTLQVGRTPLVERIVRGFHAPVIPDPAVIRYARRVTWAWTVLLACLALANAVLVTNLSPGGLLEVAGIAPRWPVPPAVFAWFSNTGTYLLIGGMFLLEFAVRVWLFPHDPFRNPLHFIRAARARMPNIVEALRHG